MESFQHRGVWFEWNICSSALELASEALKGAFGMGSYLQGYPFNSIRKHMTAVPGLIEDRASRLKRKDWQANLQEATQMETFDILSVTPLLNIHNIKH